jgi:predicted transcriptional regulator
MKTPCEFIVWNIVPVIKSEFAKSLVNDLGFNQRKAAEKLGTTEAAISRYISGKRAVLKIDDKDILQEIKKSAKKIANENGSTFIKETCTICKLMRSKNIVEGIYDSC